MLSATTFTAYSKSESSFQPILRGFPNNWGNFKLQFLDEIYTDGRFRHWTNFSTLKSNKWKIKLVNVNGPNKPSHNLLHDFQNYGIQHNNTWHYTICHNNKYNASHSTRILAKMEVYACWVFLSLDWDKD
jgi:hypothetical protein